MTMMPRWLAKMRLASLMRGAWDGREPQSRVCFTPPRDFGTLSVDTWETCTASPNGSGSPRAGSSSPPSSPTSSSAGASSRVEAELGRDCALLVTGCRIGFSSKPMEPGLLMLLATGLYFHSWLADRELFIPGPSITYIGVSDAPPGGAPGARRQRHAIVLRFLNTAGKEDGLLIRLLYPEQWVTAIKTHLITRSS
jgi:hypothetical protein